MTQIQQFKDWLALQGQSDNTTRVYISRIEYLLTEIAVENLSEATINAFLLKIKNEKSTATLNGYLHAIKIFLKFLNKEIRLPSTFKLDKKLSTYFTEEDLKTKIMPVIEQLEDELRLTAIIYFLFYTGIRVSEVNNLKREHFDFETNTVKIYVSKTKEERIALYTDKAKKALIRYFESEPEESNAFNLLASGIQTTFRRIKAKHFEDLDFNPHKFRHSFAMYCVSLGNIATSELKNMLGHHSLQSTERYVSHISTETRNKFLEASRKREENEG